MNVEHNNIKLNETEIICPSEISLDEKNTYNDSILKSLKESQYTSPNKTNILLNSLKEFSNRYDIDDRQIIKSKKFLISFNDLITLIKFALEFQIKINNSINEYINEISQDFINNLSYYIFSFEKIDTCKQNQNKFNSNNNNIKTIHKKNIINHVANKNEEKKNNKMNDSYKNKNQSGYLEIKRPLNRNNINKKKESEYKKNNKSVEKRTRSNTYFTLDLSKNESNKNKKLNKSTEKRRKINKKESEKDLNKNKNTNSLSIITVCENLKNSNFIINPKKQRKSSCAEINRTKNTYENQYQNIGIKKRIISNNIIKPSSMANKLLQKGIKYINDFKNMKEEESKKRYYS